MDTSAITNFIKDNKELLNNDICEFFRCAKAQLYMEEIDEMMRMFEIAKLNIKDNNDILKEIFKNYEKFEKLNLNYSRDREEFDKELASSCYNMKHVYELDTPIKYPNELLDTIYQDFPISIVTEQLRDKINNITHIIMYPEIDNKDDYLTTLLTVEFIDINDKSRKTIFVDESARSEIPTIYVLPRLGIGYDQSEIDKYIKNTFNYIMYLAKDLI